MRKVGIIIISATTIFFILTMIAWPNYVLADARNEGLRKNKLCINKWNEKSQKVELNLNTPSVSARKPTYSEEKPGRKGNFVFPQKNFFFNANLAIFVFQEATTASEIVFPAYGEEGSIAQNIRVSSPLGLEINAGKYIPLGKLKLKAGLGMNSFPLKATGSFKLSMPHPYLYSSPRHYYFSKEFKNSSLHFYGFVYLVPLETWRLQVSLGPIIGYSTGKYPGLEDLEIEDKSPFRWGDLEIKNKVYKSDSFSTVSFGGGLNIALFLVENLAFQFSYKYQSLKPEIAVLKNKVNLSFSRLIFCIEFAL